MFGLFKKKKKEAIIFEDCNWNKFCDWCVDTGYGDDYFDIIKTDNSELEKVAYYLFWVQSEVNNGGYQQFFSNKEDWKHDKANSLIKKYLPDDLFNNHLRAYNDFKKDNFETAEMVGDKGHELYIADNFFYDNEKRFMEILEDIADKIIDSKSTPQ
ncbi:MAG: DMP19 family protein [Firmicutes bacterium]|nr:DMP19 family protein [Bacillota bacterium]